MRLEIHYQKVCFVGCGRIARLQHAPGLERECAGLAVISACVDTYLPRAEEFAKRFSPEARVFVSLDDALASGDFDAVDLMVPHHLHEALVVQ